MLWPAPVVILSLKTQCYNSFYIHITYKLTGIVTGNTYMILRLTSCLYSVITYKLKLKLQVKGLISCKLFFIVKHYPSTFCLMQGSNFMCNYF